MTGLNQNRSHQSERLIVFAGRDQVRPKISIGGFGRTGLVSFRVGSSQRCRFVEERKTGERLSIPRTNKGLTYGLAD